jgi:DNA-binding MarR family transcriptional regulator
VPESPESPAVAQTAVAAARDLRVLVGRLRRRLREQDDANDLTASQMAVLGRLANNGPATTSDLAAAEHVRPQSMAATVGGLLERGLVARNPDPADGRRQLLTLTDSAQAFVRFSRQARDEWLARALTEKYTEPERAVIGEALRLLERLTETG